jgi:hypothetical protein
MARSYLGLYRRVLDLVGDRAGEGVTGEGVTAPA